MNPPLYQRHAWTLFVPIGLVAILISVSTVFVDGFDRDNDGLIATFGIVAGVLTLFIATVPYRRGEAWAWWALWCWPLFFGVHVALYQTFIPDMVPFGALALLGLLLPFPLVFPASKKENAPS